jgi:hypothetical protein
MPGPGRWTVRDVRRGNRAEVLCTLYFDGVSHRQELGARTGLSSATVSNVTAGLIADGVVIEVGQQDSAGGRPRILLQAGLLIGRGRLDDIRAAARLHSMAPPFSQVEITLGQLGSDAVAMGAATLVLERFLGYPPATAPAAGLGSRERRAAQGSAVG